MDTPKPRIGRGHKVTEASRLAAFRADWGSMKQAGYG
jgi:hypothetical protein